MKLLLDERLPPSEACVEGLLNITAGMKNRDDLKRRGSRPVDDQKEYTGNNFTSSGVKS